MWLQDIAEYVRDQSVDGIGMNVFIYTLKENDVGAMFTSLNTGMNASNELPDFYKGPLQLIVRSVSPKQAHDQAQAISDLLSSHKRNALGVDAGLSLPTIKVNYIYPRHLPVVYPRSDGSFFEASVNFDICFVAVPV